MHLKHKGEYKANALELPYLNMFPCPLRMPQYAYGGIFCQGYSLR